MAYRLGRGRRRLGVGRGVRADGNNERHDAGGVGLLQACRLRAFSPLSDGGMRSTDPLTRRPLNPQTLRNGDTMP